MANSCKYYKQKKQVSYDGGQTWMDVSPAEYRKGDLYERNSSDCGGGGGITIYRWVNLDASTDYYCSGTTKYYKQQKQESTDNGVTWTYVSPAEYKMGSVYEYDSEDCGHIEPQYRWINLDPSVDYYCSGTTKYYKQQRQVSYDGGETWVNVEPAEYQWGLSAETQSTDCGYIEPQYRTTSGTPYCSGYDKYVDVYSQVSYDNGSTWTTTATTPTLIEVYSQECGFIFNGKFMAIYSGSTTYSADCDSSTELTTATTKPNGYDTEQMLCAVIGDCVTSIGTNAFYYHIHLTSVTIPDSVTTIGAAAFECCSGLASIDIPDSVTSIGGDAFLGCTSLTSITIPSGVTSIKGWTFNDCINLTSITIPDSVTSIGSRAFFTCRSLPSINIPSGVTSIGDRAFGACSGLTSVTVNAIIPPTLGDAVFDYNYNCPIFVPCSSVNTYKAASGWSSYASRIQGIPPCDEPTPTFDFKFKATYSGGTTYSAACDSSTELTTATTKPSGYQYNRMTKAEIGDCVTSIGYGAFTSCSGLTSVTIPDSVTTIGNSAFGLCSSLSSITIPSSVTLIAYGAFAYCSGLTSIICNATTPPEMGPEVFYGSTCPIYVPSASVNAYKSASGWSSYADRIQAIQT